MGFVKCFKVEKTGAIFPNAYHRILSATKNSEEGKIEFELGIYSDKLVREAGCEPVLKMKFCIQEKTPSTQCENDPASLVPAELKIFEEQKIELMQIKQEQDHAVNADSSLETTVSTEDVLENRWYYKFGFDRPETNIYSACYNFLRICVAYYSDAVEV